MSHGGDIYRNRIKTDLSVSVNPLKCPDRIIETMKRAVSDAGRYPDIRHEKLIRRLSELTEIPEDRILAGNGASELIMAVFRYFQGKRILLPVPSFLGYKYAAEAAGCRLISYLMKADEKFSMAGFPDFIRDNAEPGDVILFTNPNNPNGRLADRELLDRIIRAAKEKDLYVVIDECFLTLTGREDELSGKNYFADKPGSAVRYARMIIMDAFTKTFAIPGVRLGMMYTGERQLAGEIAKLLPEWNVSCIADAAGLAALDHVEEYKRCIREDEDSSVAQGYLSKSISYIASERDRMMREIRENMPGKIRVFHSDANYILFQTGADIYSEMLERGILIRDCSDYSGLGKGFYRVSLVSREGNKEFVDNMREIVSEIRD